MKSRDRLDRAANGTSLSPGNDLRWLMGATKFAANVSGA
jgi:hypothetical protein